MTRKVLDRLQSLLVAISLAFVVWMYVNGKERWARRAHGDAVEDGSSPVKVENAERVAPGCLHPGSLPNARSTDAEPFPPGCLPHQP